MIDLVPIARQLRHEAMANGLMSATILAAAKGLLSRGFCLAQAERLANERGDLVDKIGRHIAAIDSGRQVEFRTRLVRKLRFQAYQRAFSLALWNTEASVAIDAPSDVCPDEALSNAIGTCRSGLPDGEIDMKELARRAKAIAASNLKDSNG